MKNIINLAFIARFFFVNIKNKNLNTIFIDKNYQKVLTEVKLQKLLKFRGFT